MRTPINTIINALKVLKHENPNSAAIPLLEEALKSSMKNYVLDMGSIGSVVPISDIKEAFKNGLELLGLFNER